MPVPAGNVLEVCDISNVSVPVPVFQITFLNHSTAPWLAIATLTSLSVAPATLVDAVSLLFATTPADAPTV